MHIKCVKREYKIERLYQAYAEETKVQTPLAPRQPYALDC